MAIFKPNNAGHRYGIDLNLPIDQAAISNGIAVSHLPGADPLTSTIATRGFAGVLAQSVDANTTGAIQTVHVAITADGEEEVLLGGTVASVGQPLTINSVNRFIVATTGTAIWARAKETGASGDKIIARLGYEGLVP
jgi:hypothetical protein